MPINESCSYRRHWLRTEDKAKSWTGWIKVWWSLTQLEMFQSLSQMNISFLAGLDVLWELGGTSCSSMAGALGVSWILPWNPLGWKSPLSLSSHSPKHCQAHQSPVSSGATGDSITAPGSLLRGLTTLSMKNFSSYPNQTCSAVIQGRFSLSLIAWVS